MFNAQHDCVTAECGTVAAPLIQERSATQQTIDVIAHNPLKRYFLNMHAIHNAVLIRETLPRHLSKPTRYFENRLEKLQEFAGILQLTGPAKRAESAAKAKETRLKKKALAAQSMAAEGSSGIVSEVPDA